MKKIAILLLVVFLVLALTACGGTNKSDENNETNGSDASISTPDTEQSKDTAPSYDNVPGTNVSVYPGSQQVYSSKNEIVYATTDSGNEVDEFYKNHPDLKRIGGQEGVYAYATPLTDLMRGMGTDPDKYQEKIDEINAYINESGVLIGLIIYDNNVDAQYKENQFGSNFSELPTDKTLIQYTLLEEKEY